MACKYNFTIEEVLEDFLASARAENADLGKILKNFKMREKNLKIYF